MIDQTEYVIGDRVRCTPQGLPPIEGMVLKVENLVTRHREPRPVTILYVVDGDKQFAVNPAMWPTEIVDPI